MPRKHGCESIYRLADDFRKRCLVGSNSLLWPDAPAWSADNVRALLEAQLYEKQEKFLTTYEKQLGNHPLEVHRVAADALVVNYLFIADDHRPRSVKVRDVQRVVSWRLGESEPNWEALAEAFGDAGLGRVSNDFLGGWSPTEYLLRFALQAKAGSVDLNDAHAVQALADSIVPSKSREMRNVLLHLLFPDKFENIALPIDRERILKRFADAAGEGAEDQQLGNIRRSLADSAGSGFDFYDENVHALWRDVDVRNELPRRYWIFQANPDDYDAAAAVRHLSQLACLVRQHPSEIHTGDQTFIWEAGAVGGVVAIGTVLTEPQQMEAGEDEAPFERNASKFAGPQLRVLVRVDRVPEHKVARQDLKTDERFAELAFLRMSQGSNFPLSDTEANALMDLIDRRNRPPQSYTGLLSHLRATGLHFSEELVSNYLLALQSKRFAILTGISGTGKTQLALAIAKYFQPSVEVKRAANPPADAVEARVFPYMLKYHQMVVPRELAASLIFSEMEAVPDRKSPSITVHYPGGRANLALYRDPNRPVTSLVFSGAFREWFDTNLSVGETFFLRVSIEKGQSNLLVDLPRQESRTEELSNYEVVAVRPDWTDNRGLLGYFNPLTKQYNKTPFLELLLKASDDPAHAYFLILDEMNLARVEHYFSDFLSCLESGEALHLHDSAEVEAGEVEDSFAIPRRFHIPDNVFFTGTVNVDETTYMFSPKVLDRAFTIELNEVDLRGYTTSSLSQLETSPTALHLQEFAGWGAWEKPGEAHWRRFADLDLGQLRDMVVGLHSELAREQRHFGFRVANEIARFVTLAAQQTDGTSEARWSALDLAILEKVLPKFHGTQQELTKTLENVFAFAVDPHAGSPISADGWTLEGATLVAQQEVAHTTVLLPRTASKVWRMLQRLKAQGFVSFIE